MSSYAAYEALPTVAWPDDGALGLGGDFIDRVMAQQARHWAAVSPRGLEILKYGESQKALRSRDLVVISGRRGDASGLTPADGWIYDHHYTILPNLNGAKHVSLRGLFTDYFSPRRINDFRPAIADIVRDLTVAAVKAGNGSLDLAHDVCMRTPGVFFAHMLGAPVSDVDFLTRVAESMLKIFHEDPAYRDEIVSAAEELKAYTYDLLADRRKNMGEDIISHLIRAQGRGQITESELVHHVAMLLEASADNTGNQFGLTMLNLLEEPSRWEAVVRDPSKIRRAIDENMRMYPRVPTVNRYAAQDTELCGVVIPEGTWISVSALAAQRDPDGMPGADTFDLDREITRPNLQFGGGVHMCLGTNLAHVEIEVGVAVLAELVPSLRLVAEPQWELGPRLSFCSSLPVAVDEVIG